MEQYNNFKLPVEMWKEIFVYLPMEDQCSVRLVCKDFKAIMEDKYIHKFTFKINQQNVKKIRESIENNEIVKDFFKSLQLDGIENIEDIQFILEAVGNQIEYLSMHNTAVFKHLKDNVKNLKSLKLYCDSALFKNAQHLNLNDLPALEHLECKLLRHECSKVIEDLLYQLVQQPAKLQCLRHLKVDCSIGIERQIINVLMHTTTLECLDLSYLKNADSYFDLWKEALPHLLKLKTLRFGTMCSDDWLQIVLENLPAEAPLQHIKLVGGLETFFLKDELLIIISNKWKNSLKALELDGCFLLTDTSLNGLNKYPKLRSIHISSLKHLTCGGFLQAFATKINTVIEELDLSGFIELDQWSLGVILYRMKNLRILKLELIETDAITNHLLSQIFSLQTKLRVLHLNPCNHLTDDGFIGFDIYPFPIRKLKNLEELSLRTCSQLTDRMLIEAIRLPSLRKLELIGCHNITIKGFKILVLKCPNLNTLGISMKILSDNNIIPVIGNGFKRLRCLYAFCDFLSAEDQQHIENNISILREGYSLKVEYK